MGSIFRKIITRQLPPGAEIVNRRGERFRAGGTVEGSSTPPS